MSRPGPSHERSLSVRFLIKVDLVVQVLRQTCGSSGCRAIQLVVGWRTPIVSATPARSALVRVGRPRYWQLVLGGAFLLRWEHSGTILRPRGLPPWSTAMPLLRPTGAEDTSSRVWVWETYSREGGIQALGGIRMIQSRRISCLFWGKGTSFNEWVWVDLSSLITIRTGSLPISHPMHVGSKLALRCSLAQGRSSQPPAGLS